MNQTFRLLVRHFLRRFLDNDLVSPNAESHANTALFLAFLVVPNLLGSMLLVFRYGNPWVLPCERLMIGLNDKLAFLSTSMILTALVTVVEWDALWLDARDHAILRPLPLPNRTLVGAKLAALGLFVTVVATLVNAIPTLVFPLFWFMTVPLGFLVIARVVAVHALVSLASAAFAFAVILGVRGLLVTVLPPRISRAASAVVQFVAILALVSGFLLSPALYHDAGKRLASGSRIAQAAPPMWFLGMYERLTARAVLDDPGVISGRHLREWQEDEEAAARAAYLALEPTLGVLARRAAIGLGAAAVLALGLFVFGHSRRPAHLSVASPSGSQPRWRRAVVAALVWLCAGRRPSTRATFVFTLQALARSARHRLYVAGYLAGGIALVVASQDPRIVRDASARISALTTPEPGTLVLQLVLVFCLIMSVRVGFPIPAELRANWIFRVTEPADLRRLLAGPRRALRAIAVGLLAVLVPWHAVLWGWTLALQHFAVGAMISLVLVEAVLLGFQKVPFASPYVPARSRLRYTWPLYLFLFWTITYFCAAVEFLVMRSQRSFAVFLLLLAALLAGLALARRRRLRQLPALVFDESDEPAVQTLGLMQ